MVQSRVSNYKPPHSASHTTLYQRPPKSVSSLKSKFDSHIKGHVKATKNHFKQSKRLSNTTSTQKTKNEISKLIDDQNARAVFSLAKMQSSTTNLDRNKASELEAANTAQKVSTRTHMLTPGQLGSFNNPISKLTTSPVEILLDPPTNSVTKMSLNSARKSMKLNVRYTTSDVDSEYDSEDEEDLEEECKGIFNFCNNVLDIVPSPEKLPDMYRSHKNYVENQFITTSMTQSQSLDNDKILRESTEILEQTDGSPGQKYPILFVDVNLGDERVERLTVYEGKYTYNGFVFG
jgi:hypothetical protein